MDQESPLIVDSNHIEPKVVKAFDAQNYAKEVLSFIASQSSQNITIANL
jgi:hypothetical protein